MPLRKEVENCGRIVNSMFGGLSFGEILVKLGLQHLARNFEVKFGSAA
jgi:hypothetical protein